MDYRELLIANVFEAAIKFADTEIEFERLLEKYMFYVKKHLDYSILQ